MAKVSPSFQPGVFSGRRLGCGLAGCFAWLVHVSACWAAGVPEQPDYNKHVRPILAAACFKCHGADEKQRKGKLRLDARDAAVEKHAIVPGQPDESELIKRILTSEEDEVMPPVKEHKDLTAEQKEILRRWIAGGAEYKKHWAFIPPVKVAVPEIAGMDGSDAHAIDAFVLQRLRDEHLQPAPAAAKERWLRRVTLDLTGLPPSLEEIDAFLADGSQEARGKVVDRLLADKNFGEHLATDWLDVARYADTYGRHEDAESAVWRYRDWVVDAFNANLPYDQFVIWQTAGDLLPSPTRAQYIATAFNRLVPQSNEAGSNEEEFRQEHVADRVKTNATAFLGLTMECARCHDHKYDPISMRDYYSFSGFFNNIDELGLFARQTAGIPSPSLLILTPGDEAKLTAIQKQITEKEKELSGIRGGAKERFKSWCGSNGMPGVARPVAHYDFATLTGKKASDKKMLYDLVHPKEAPATVRQTPQAIARGDNTGIRFQNDNTMEMPETVGAFRRSDAFSLSFWFETMVEQEKAVLVHRTRGALDAASRGYEIILNHGYVEFALAHFAPGNSIRIRSKNVLPLNQWMHLAASYDGSSKAAGLKLFLDGKPMECEVVRDHLYRDILYRKEWGDFDDSKIQDNGTPVIKLSLAWRYNDMGLKDGAFDEFMVFDLALTQPEVATLAGAATAAPERGWWDKLWGNHPMPANIEDWLDAWLRDTDDAWKKAAAELHTLRTQEDDLINGADEIMVMREQEQQRPTHVLTRGQFDQPGDAVTPETPSALPPMAPGLPRNRLGLAQWMVDRQNPLTARVAVNRLWQHFFGIGLVATQEDFGIQGELPAHPELLDWLACDFMEHGWDMKRLCRMIALSQTYGQSAIPVERTMESNDPQNRLLARGPRHRMTAEEVRDTALAVSSLLMRTSGGAPVKPYQPEGLYEDSGIQAHYTQDHGDSLWRRSLYTFRKRTMPPPNMIVFDSPSREFCRVRRECTNTPLQALTLLNDPQFLESCRVCAEHELQQHPRDLDACIAESFRRWTSRAPKAEELAVLRNLLDEERSWYAAHLQEAAQVRRANGEATVDETLPDVDVAALTAVERALLCDDETLVIQ